MKYFIFVLLISGIAHADTFYCHRSDGAYMTYSGMTKEAVNKMLSDQNLSCEYITKQTLDAVSASLTTAEKSQADARKQVSDALIATVKDSKLTIQQRFDALVSYLGI